MSRPYLHLYIGTLSQSVDDSMPLHNRFSKGGANSAKAISGQMGNLSHTVYLEARPIGAGRIMLLDYWRDAEMMASFFADPNVVAAGKALCTTYEETTWEGVSDAYQFQFPVPAGATVDALATVQSPITALVDTTREFSELALGNAALGRQRGQIGHSVFRRLGEAGNDEILAMDQWSSLEGLEKHYQDATAWPGFGESLTGPRQEGVWIRSSDFVEW